MAAVKAIFLIKRRRRHILLFLFLASFSLAAASDDTPPSSSSHADDGVASCTVVSTNSDDTNNDVCILDDTASCKDDDEACQDRGVHHCDEDPSWMLVHCRKTCSICFVYGTTTSNSGIIEQNAGFGKLPLDVSVQVLQVIRRTNLYYQNITTTTDASKYVLINHDNPCRDQNDMCAYWSFRGQCHNAEYATYMDRECPLTCQRCDVSRGRLFLQFLLGNLTEAYNDGGSSSDDPKTSERNVVSNRHRSLSLLMSTVGMDPSLLGKYLTKDAGNWLQVLHERIHALIPSVLLNLYRKQQELPDDDFHLLASIHGLDSRSKVVLTSNILMPYRSRGSIVSIMRDVDHLITRPIQLGVGFAVPNEASMVAIQQFAAGSSVIQMGAGAGYWAGVLRHYGVNVLAYDVRPPSDATNDESNAFFDVAYIKDIQQGSCISILDSNPQLADDHTLLLIWPNDPDPVDNTQFGESDKGSEPVWDADCLLSYLQAGGRKVVYVGERESQIRGEGGDCGISSTRRFQQLLSDHFSLVGTIPIPNWWLNEDDVTMWERDTS